MASETFPASPLSNFAYPNATCLLLVRSCSLQQRGVPAEGGAPHQPLPALVCECLWLLCAASRAALPGTLDADSCCLACSWRTGG